MKFSVYIICLLLLSNCSGNSYQKSIIENHNRIAINLANSAYSHYRRGGGEALIFNTFKEQKENFYFFEVTNGTLILKKRNTQFEEEIIKQKNITNYVLNLEKQLDSLNIKGYNGQPNGLGVLLELNMNDGSTIVYTEDTSRISHALTLKYIRKAKRLCNNWYYSKDWY